MHLHWVPASLLAYRSRVHPYYRTFISSASLSPQSASIATIVRMRYLLAYQDPDDYVYGIAPIAIWSEVECCIGIVAGSLSTMRPLLRYLGVRNLTFGHHASPTATIRPNSPNCGHSLHQIKPSVSRIAASYRHTAERRRDDARPKGGLDDYNNNDDDGASQRRILDNSPLRILVESGYEVTVEENNSGTRGER